MLNQRLLTSYQPILPKYLIWHDVTKTITMFSQRPSYPGDRRNGSVLAAIINGAVDQQLTIPGATHIAPFPLWCANEFHAVLLPILFCMECLQFTGVRVNFINQGGDGCMGLILDAQQIFCL